LSSCNSKYPEFMARARLKGAMSRSFLVHRSSGAYSFFGTCLILACLDFLGKFMPVFKLRASEEEEILGIDDVEIGEFAYDYVELSRDVKSVDDIDGSSQHSSPNGHYSGEPKSYDSSRPLASLGP